MTSPSAENLTTIDGATHVNRAGLCELTGLSPVSINHMCAPSRRTATGCPEPAKVGRTLWYPLTEVLPWVEQLQPPPQRERPPDTTSDPDELITVDQFRREFMPEITDNTIRSYVRKSRPAWERGKDGILPRPDEDPPARRGNSPRWRRRRAAAWKRPGKPTTGRPTDAERRPQPAAPIDDPNELIGETHFRTRIARPPLSQAAWYRLIAESEAAWERGEDGVLLRPDATEDHAGATRRKWRAGRAVEWQNARAAEAAQTPS